MNASIFSMVSTISTTMGRSEDRPPQGIAQPGGSQAEHDLGGDVDEGASHLRVASERQRLVGKTRERREAAEHTDEQKHAQIRAEHLSGIDQGGHQANDEAARDIDDESAERKGREG